MEIEVLIDYIKEARIKGFRDDVIKKGLLHKGYPQEVIENAFSNSGRPKRADARSRMRIDTSDNAENSITILLDDWLKYAIEKKAEKDKLTLRTEIKKTLVENTPAEGIRRELKKKTMIRKRRTEEQRARHNMSSRKYAERVRKERKNLEKVKKKEERKARRKGLFGDWVEEVRRQE